MLGTPPRRAPVPWDAHAHPHDGRHCPCCNARPVGGYFFQCNVHWALAYEEHDVEERGRPTMWCLAGRCQTLPGPLTLQRHCAVV